MNLIKRQNNPNDKRTYLVSLTSLGRDTYDAIQIREMTELQTLCDEFDSEELLDSKSLPAPNAATITTPAMIKKVTKPNPIIILFILFITHYI